VGGAPHRLPAVTPPFLDWLFVFLFVSGIQQVVLMISIQDFPRLVVLLELSLVYCPLGLFQVLFIGLVVSKHNSL
jgi:hypothetical protein